MSGVPIFANGAQTAALQYLYNEVFSESIKKTRAAIAARAEAAYANGEAYGYHDRAGNFPAGSYKCNKFVYDVAISAGAEVPDLYGGGWPPTARAWGNPNVEIPGWEIVNTPQAGDVVGQWRNYSDATGHVGIVVDNNLTVVSARTNGVSRDSFGDVFPSKYSRPVVYRRYVGK